MKTLIQILKYIVAVPLTIAFIPFAFLICCSIGLILFPGMVADCFMEVIE